MRFAALVAFALAAPAGTAPAEESKNITPEVTKGLEEKPWSFSLSATTYVVPDFREYVQPTFSADHSWLHLESRYNYENLKSGSLWVGYNFGGGEKLAWEFTPMFGGVFGDTTGVAPGYRLSLSYWKLEFSNEGEFVFDTGDKEGSFLYFWSELSIAPVDWFRFGVVGQRTRAYQSDLDIQRGLLVGFSHKKVDFTTYVFNLDRGKPTWVFAVGLSF